MLAVLPTGYGKSAAFTYPLIYESRAGVGLSVIVVPTNTLKRQILRQLREAGVHAVAFGDKLPRHRNAQQLGGAGLPGAVPGCSRFRLNIWFRRVRFSRR